MEEPAEGDAGGFGGEDHGVLGAAFAVAAGPEAAEDEVVGLVPEESMVEAIEALVGGEVFPGGGVDVGADALDVEEAFDGDEVVGFEAEVVDVVVPAGVFTEGGEIEARLGFAFELVQRGS